MHGLRSRVIRPERGADIPKSHLDHEVAENQCLPR